METIVADSPSYTPFKPNLVTNRHWIGGPDPFYSELAPDATSDNDTIGRFYCIQTAGGFYNDSLFQLSFIYSKVSKNGLQGIILLAEPGFASLGCGAQYPFAKGKLWYQRCLNMQREGGKRKTAPEMRRFIERKILGSIFDLYLLKPAKLKTEESTRGREVR